MQDHATESHVDVRLHSLTRQQATALAQLCKRLTWTDAVTLSVDSAEAGLMIRATDLLRAALEDAGIYVR